MRKYTFFPCFSEKTTIFAAEKELVAMRATVIERDCKSQYLAPANCKFAGTGDVVGEHVVERGNL